MERVLEMRPLTTVLVFSVLMLVGCGLESEQHTRQKRSDTSTGSESRAQRVEEPEPLPPTITVVTADNRARLCRTPACGDGEELARVPTGTVLDVQAKRSVRLPRWDVIWYQVSFKGKQGWVSEFETNLAPPTRRYR